MPRIRDGLLLSHGDIAFLVVDDCILLYEIYILSAMGTFIVNPIRQPWLSSPPIYSYLLMQYTAKVHHSQTVGGLYMGQTRWLTIFCVAAISLFRFFEGFH